MSSPNRTDAGRTNARREGDDFQARIFWLQAAHLLNPKSSIVRVTFESGPVGFNDLLVDYDPTRAPNDHEGNPILRWYIQCKWHTRAGEFGYADLADPKFIRTKESLLQRAYQAQRTVAVGSDGCRFELLTNWRVRSEDPLFALIRKNSHTLDLDKLFAGKTGRMAQVRAFWREHLGIDDIALRSLARTLVIADTPESLDQLRERVNDRFAAVGIDTAPVHSSTAWFDDLIFKLCGQGRREFDRESLRAMLKGEHRLTSPARHIGVLDLGIRSFMHQYDQLEQRCSLLLDLVRYFDGRYIRASEDWQRQVFPQLRNFLNEHLPNADHVRLLLDVHASLAFAVGTLLGPKSGRRIDIEQRTSTAAFWRRDDQATDPTWPAFAFHPEKLGPGNDLALAISLTREVSDDVRIFVQSKLPCVGEILHCRVQGGASDESVACGRHAWNLAASIVPQVSPRRREKAGRQRVHVFAAVPNAFMVFLGQQRQMLGPIITYEWDFDGDCGYSVGLNFGPGANEATGA